MGLDFLNKVLAEDDDGFSSGAAAEDDLTWVTSLKQWQRFEDFATVERCPGLSAAKLPQDLATGLSLFVISELFFLLRFGEPAPLPGAMDS
jgi:hypothetical protein